MSDAALARYLALFTALTPGRLAELDALTTEDVRFRDPFNDTVGAAAMRRVFEHMFATLDQPRFVIVHRAMAGTVGLVAWRFTARTRRGGRRIEIEGMSAIQLAEDGRVAVHVDHWDPARQLYEAIPIIGGLLRLLRHRLRSR